MHLNIILHKLYSNNGCSKDHKRIPFSSFSALSVLLSCSAVKAKQIKFIINISEFYVTFCIHNQPTVFFLLRIQNILKY